MALVAALMAGGLARRLGLDVLVILVAHDAASKLVEIELLLTSLFVLAPLLFEVAAEAALVECVVEVALLRAVKDDEVHVLLVTPVGDAARESAARLVDAETADVAASVPVGEPVTLRVNVLVLVGV